MKSDAERLARLEGAYDHLATKADLANLRTWVVGVLLVVVLNVFGTIAAIVAVLLTSG